MKTLYTSLAMTMGLVLFSSTVAFAAVHDLTGDSRYRIMLNREQYGIMHVRVHGEWGTRNMTIRIDGARVAEGHRLTVKPGEHTVTVTYTPKSGEAVTSTQPVTVKAGNLVDIDYDVKKNSFTLTDNSWKTTAVIQDYIGFNIAYAWLYDNGTNTHNGIWGISYGHFFTRNLSLRVDANVWYPWVYNEASDELEKDFTYPLQFLAGVVWYINGNSIDDGHYLKAQAGAMVPVVSPDQTSINLVLGWGYKSPFGHTLFGFDVTGLYKPVQGTLGIGVSASLGMAFF